MPGYRPEFKDYDAADGYSNGDITIFEVRRANTTYPVLTINGNGAIKTGTGAAAPATNFDVVAADVTMADATLAASGLSIPVLAGVRYKLDAVLEWVSPEADDVKFQVNVPTGGSGRGAVIALAVAATAVTGDLNASIWVADAATTVGVEDTGPVHCSLSGYVVGGTANGNVTITVAKAADAGADGTLEAGSWLHLTPMA
jgi:hypothetical protein